MDAELFLLLSDIYLAYNFQPNQMYFRSSVSSKDVHENTFEIQGNKIGCYRRMVIVAMHLSKQKQNQQIHLKARLKFKHSNW